MATIEPIRGEWPQVTVIVHSHGRLDLGHVGKFLQRLDTAARSAGRRADFTPRIEVVELSSGSIKTILEAIGVAIAAADLAVHIAEYIESNPAAARACHELIAQDKATHITVEGGTNTFVFGPEQLPRWEDAVAQAASHAEQPEQPATSLPKVVPGPHAGTLKRIDGGLWVQLDEWPGLIMEVRDQRATKSLLQEDLRYSFDGDAVIGPPGKSSAFILRGAILLE